MTTNLAKVSTAVDLLVQTIEECISQERILPAVLLLYSGIDIVASLDRHDGEPTQGSFVRWLDSHLMPFASLPCTALDLYGARCGLLHANSSDSGLSRMGRAIPVFYAHGNASAATLQHWIDFVGRRAVAVYLPELVEAFKVAAKRFLEEVQADPMRAAVAAQVASGWMIPVATDELDAWRRAGEVGE